MRHLLAYILPALLAAGGASAQDTAADDITTIDWSVLRVDSVPPVYNEVVPLESDYTANDYTVSVDYPEYAPLTPAEAVRAAAYAGRIGEDINVETCVGVERGRGLLDISFVPLVRREGRLMKLTSAQITIRNTPRRAARTTAPRAKADRYTRHSRLSEGRWVKINITDDGMYRLTRRALLGMGFSNPQNVHLYGYGGHRQKELIDADTDYDDLVEVPLYHSPKTDSWLFWGNGLIHWEGDTHVRNHYARTASYFLHEEDSPSAIATLEPCTDEPRQTLTSYRAHVLYEPEEYAWFHAGRKLVQEYNFRNGSKTYTLAAPDPVPGEARVTVVLTAFSKVETRVRPTVNGENMEQIVIERCGEYTYAAESARTYTLSNKNGTVTDWRVRIPENGGADTRLDYISVHYDRRLTPQDDGQVLFTGTGSGTTRFDITGTGLTVMRLGRPGQPAALVPGTQSGGTYSVTVSDPAASYVAFDPVRAFPEPAVAGTVANQDLHAVDSVDMVIIIPASGKLASEAQRLRDAHLAHDSLRTAVVRADQIYNEFSSGTPDATAYRRFMKMLYDRGAGKGTAPCYLLLMGDCAWDNRMLTPQWRRNSPDDYLLCYESDESYSDTKSYCMEDYFGLLDDGEGADLVREKADLGIGRFPVTNATSAKIMVDKTIAYMTNSNAGTWRNQIYFLGDDGDNNDHMKYADQVAERVRLYYPELEVHKIMWDSYTRVGSAKSNTYPEVTALLKRLMSQGAMVMNYTGHSAVYGLSHEYVLLLEDFKNTHGDNLPLWVTCSCDAMPFDGQAENLGEAAVLNAGGGALAFYGTARTVYASQNVQMNRYFMDALFATVGGRRNRIGDAIRTAKSSIISAGAESGYRENKLQYALLGDPALVIGQPQQRIVLDSINGRKVSSYQYIHLRAGERVRIAGHVQESGGSTATTFNGAMTTRLYDNEETIVCKNNAGAPEAFKYSDRTNLLHESQDSIRDGRFAMDFIIPVDINYSNEAGRFVFYAINNERTQEANGYSERLTLGGIVDDLGYDNDGPQIAAYLNDEMFQDGDIVGCTPYFVAQLSDESGINASGNGIGHDITLCVDGRADMTYVLNDYYVREFGDFTRGSVAFSIPALDAGEHTATLRAWDVLGHTNTATLRFAVDPAMRPNILSVAASMNPATENTTFLIQYDMPGSECRFTIEVFNFMGAAVWTHTERGSNAGSLYSIPWNLTNNRGGKLNSGIYLYRCTMQCGESKEVSKTQKIIILDNK